MSGFLLRIFIGIALAFAAHAQPKPPPDKAPTNDAKPPAAPDRARPAPGQCARALHRLPRHPGLQDRVPRGLPRAQDRRPAAGLHRQRAQGVQVRRALAPVDARHRGDADRRRHEEARRPLRGARNEAARAGHRLRARRRGARGRQRRAGKEKAAQVCAACHGPDGNKPSDPTQPVLAGQHYDYLVRALRTTRAGGATTRS